MCTTLLCAAAIGCPSAGRQATTGPTAPAQSIHAVDDLPRDDVRRFGAACDGRTDDTAAFNTALAAINERGGTILVPSGRTCLVTQINLGAVGSPATSASGVTIRGAASMVARTTNVPGSAILIDPPSVSPRTCSLVTSTNVNGGIVFGPNVNRISFEDIALQAGSNLVDCVVNASQDNRGDVYNIRFRHVAFLGNGHSCADSHPCTDADLYLGYDSYVTVEECVFGNAQHDIKMDGAPYLNSAIIVNNLFYPLANAPQAAYEVEIDGAASGLHVAGNAFGYAVNGLKVAGMRGGDVTSNLFNGEGIPNPTDIHGSFIDVNCMGCTIANNEFQGTDRSGSQTGISVTGTAASVVGNHFSVPLTGGAISIQASGSTVANNRFDGGEGANADIDVTGGVGYVVGPNLHLGKNSWSMQLAAGTRGVLYYDSSNDTTLFKAVDATLGAGGGPGGWTKSANGVLTLPGGLGVGTPSPTSKLHVAGGNVYVSTPGDGIILRAPNGLTCALVVLTNAGTLATRSTPCP
jgi:hypothetical protein